VEFPYDVLKDEAKRAGSKRFGLGRPRPRGYGQDGGSYGKGCSAGCAERSSPVKQHVCRCSQPPGWKAALRDGTRRRELPFRRAPPAAPRQPALAAGSDVGEG
jgi:hypothetical protein